MLLKILGVFGACVVGYLLTHVFGFIKKLLYIPNISKTIHFKDSAERSIIYHGVNICNYSKHSEDYLPWHKEEDYARLKAWGINLVRFTVFWDAIEPKRNECDFDYLKKVSEHVELLGRYGIDVILDIHQDVYSKKFNGNGFPLWAVLDEGKPFKAQKEWALGYLQPAVQATAKNFWRSADLKVRYQSVIRLLAEDVGKLPNVIGIDIFNEPFPYLPILFNFEKKYLSKFYKEALVLADACRYKKPLFFEPWMCASAGIPTYLDPELCKGNSVYFPHSYLPLAESRKNYGKFYKLITAIGCRIRAKEAQLFNSPLIYGEWGIAPNVKGYLNYAFDFIELAEKYQASWIWWSYDKIQHSGNGLIDNTGKEQEIVRVLSHVYPQKIAGKNFQYSNSLGEFLLTYDNVGIVEPTVVYVPERLMHTVKSNCRYEVSGNLFMFYNDAVLKPEIHIIYKE
jgi:endoglycosylceramidase